MGQFEAVAVRAPRSTSGAARRLLLGALASASMAMAALSSPGLANATCASISGVGVGAGCTSTPASFAVELDTDSSPSAHGLFEEASPVGNPVMVAESMVGTDAFGPYGCEDFVDAVYGRTTATGIGHDEALAFYRSLADRGLAHHEMPIPRGALVFSTGADGDHVDISRGDGTYISAGVQGLSPGYGDGRNIQILPTPNLGSWTLYGWVYPPW
jgi:hypothetical protein